MTPSNPTPHRPRFFPSFWVSFSITIIFIAAFIGASFLPLFRAGLAAAGLDDLDTWVYLAPLLLVPIVAPAVSPKYRNGKSMLGLCAGLVVATALCLAGGVIFVLYHPPLPHTW